MNPKDDINYLNLIRGPDFNRKEQIQVDKYGFVDLPRRNAEKRRESADANNLVTNRATGQPCVQANLNKNGEMNLNPNYDPPKRVNERPSVDSTDRHSPKNIRQYNQDISQEPPRMMQLNRSPENRLHNDQRVRDQNDHQYTGNYLPPKANFDKGTPYVNEGKGLNRPTIEQTNQRKESNYMQSEGSSNKGLQQFAQKFSWIKSNRDRWMYMKGKAPYRNDRNEFLEHSYEDHYLWDKNSTKSEILFKIFLIVVLFASLFVLFISSGNVKPFCDKNKSITSKDCEECPDNAECEEGLMTCKLGYLREGRRCVESDALQRKALLILKTVSRDLNVQDSYNKCKYDSKSEGPSLIKMSEIFNYIEEEDYDLRSRLKNILTENLDDHRTLQKVELQPLDENKKIAFRKFYSVKSEFLPFGCKLSNNLKNIIISAIILVVLFSIITFILGMFIGWYQDKTLARKYYEQIDLLFKKEETINFDRFKQGISLAGDEKGRIKNSPRVWEMVLNLFYLTECMHLNIKYIKKLDAIRKSKGNYFVFEDSNQIFWTKCK